MTCNFSCILEPLRVWGQLRVPGQSSGEEAGIYSSVESYQGLTLESTWECPPCPWTTRLRGPNPFNIYNEMRKRRPEKSDKTLCYEFGSSRGGSQSNNKIWGHELENESILEHWCPQNICLRNPRANYCTALEKGEEGSHSAEDQKRSLVTSEEHLSPCGSEVSFQKDKNKGIALLGEWKQK